MSKGDLYEALGVSKSASDTEIAKAYRTLARTHHPDKGGNEETFKAVQRAYDVLSDPKAREFYNQTGVVPGEEGAPVDGGGGMPFGAFGMADLFSGLFSGGGFHPMRRGGGRRPEKAPPRIERLPLSLAQYYNGGILNIGLNREKFCSVCKGKGSKVLKSCDKCGGSGNTIHNMMLGPGMIVQTHGPCDSCNGRGEQKGEACNECKGGGLVRQQKAIEVRITAGATAGDTLVFENEASDTHEFERGSDLHIVLESADDPNGWIRDGDNLRNSVEISLTESLCGCFVALRGWPGVATSEEIHVEIPRGTQNGTEVFVAGRGMPRKDGVSHGHIYLKVNVAVKESEQRVLVESAESVAALFKHSRVIFTGDKVWSATKAI